MYYDDFDAYQKWFHNEATPEDLALYDRVESFHLLFDDMLFRKETCSFELTTAETDEGRIGDELPYELREFDYSWFRYKSIKQENCKGSFTIQEALLCAPPDADDADILHEMIHLHEMMIHELSLYWHDMMNIGT